MIVILRGDRFLNSLSNHDKLWIAIANGCRADVVDTP